MGKTYIIDSHLKVKNNEELVNFLEKNLLIQITEIMI